MGSGIDLREYDRRNYHGTSSSQPCTHQAHILPPRYFPLSTTVKVNNKPNESAKRFHSEAVENIAASPQSQPSIIPPN